MAPNRLIPADRNPRVARVRPLNSNRWRGATIVIRLFKISGVQRCEILSMT